MRRNVRLAVVSLLAVLPAAIAWRSAGDPLGLAPQSKLWIDGKSTVRKFTCKASAFTVDVDAAPGNGSARIARPARTAFACARAAGSMHPSQPPSNGPPQREPLRSTSCPRWQINQ